MIKCSQAIRLTITVRSTESKRLTFSCLHSPCLKYFKVFFVSSALIKPLQKGLSYEYSRCALYFRIWNLFTGSMCVKYQSERLVYPDAIDSAHVSNPAMCKLWFGAATFIVTRIRITVTAAADHTTTALHAANDTENITHLVTATENNREAKLGTKCRRIWEN